MRLRAPYLRSAGWQPGTRRALNDEQRSLLPASNYRSGAFGARIFSFCIKRLRENANDTADQSRRQLYLQQATGWATSQVAWVKPAALASMTVP